jgi:hypothetical protein
MSDGRNTVVFDVSGHGFGHLAQVTPVIRDLAQDANLRIVVRSALPADVISNFVGGTIETASAPPDVTMAMRGPSTVDVAATAARYRDLHADWTGHVTRAAHGLAALRPALLVADVPYLSLAAAQRLGIPNIALCSLNWLDIYRAYCGDEPDAPAILRAMENVYRSVDVFLQPEPHMPMANLQNRRGIGPIGRIGRNRREAVCRTLGIALNSRLVLATLGGIAVDEPLPLPPMTDVHWLADNGSAAGRGDVSDLNQLGMSFIDVLASCDAVLTKLGYGTFVEAACNGVSVVSAPRADWPENAGLMRWVVQYANFAEVENGLGNAASIASAVAAVLRAPRKASVAPSGITEAVACIRRFLQ